MRAGGRELESRRDGTDIYLMFSESPCRTRVEALGIVAVQSTSFRHRILTAGSETELGEQAGKAVGRKRWRGSGGSVEERHSSPF